MFAENTKTIKNDTVLKTFNASVIFEAAGAIAKTASNLKPSLKLSLSEYVF